MLQLQVREIEGDLEGAVSFEGLVVPGLLGGLSIILLGAFPLGPGADKRVGLPPNREVEWLGNINNGSHQIMRASIEISNLE